MVKGEQFLGGVEPATDLEGPADRDIMAIIYTSGTTGPSKGVLVPWAELHWFADSLPDDMFQPGDRYYSPYPAFHMSGKSALYQTALADATLIIRESFSPTAFWGDIRDHGVTVLGDPTLVHSVDAQGLVVPGADRVVAVVGLRDVVVIDTGDAVLVTSRERAQDVKAIVAALKERGAGRLT